VDAVRTKLRALPLDQRGATAIEYGLIAGLIAVAIIGGVSALGGGTSGMWTNIAARIAAVT
jgi:pilus assembly protein Flp/PilA